MEKKKNYSWQTREKFAGLRSARFKLGTYTGMRGSELRPCCRIITILYYNLNLCIIYTGGRSDRRHTGRRAQRQVANGVLDGRQMLHDVRKRRVLGTGAAHGVRSPWRASAVDGHWRGRRNPVADGRAGHCSRQRRPEMSQEIRHDHR